MRHGLFKAARGVGIALLVPIVLVAATLGWLLGTESGTRYSVNTFLDFYNRAVPGEIVVENISGTVFEGLTLREAALLDREREPIITADEVFCAVSFSDLLSGTLHGREVRVTGAALYLRFYDDESSFIDLAPYPDSGGREDDPEEPFDELVLPLSLAVDTVALQDVQLIQVSDEGENGFLSAAVVSISGEWSGGDARFRIHNVDAQLVEPALHLRRFEGTAHLEGGTFARLEGGRAVTDRGTVSLGETSFRIDTLDGSAHFDIDSKTDAVAEWVPFSDTEEINVRAAVRLERGERFVTTLTARVGEAAVNLNTETELDRFPESNMTAELSDLNAALFGLPVEATADARATLSLEGGFPVRGSARLDCMDCTVAPVGKTTFGATVEIAGEEVRGEVDASAVGADLHSTGSFSSDGSLSLAWNLSAKNVRSLKDRVPVRRLGGALRAEGSCNGTVDDISCRFRADGKALSAESVRVGALKAAGRFAVRDGIPALDGEVSLSALRAFGFRLSKAGAKFQRVPDGFRLTAEGEDGQKSRFFVSGGVRSRGEYLVISLEDLRSTLAGLPVRTRSPVSITFAEKMARIEDGGAELALLDGTATLQGSLKNGRIHGARLVASDIDLAFLEPFLREIGPGGIASVTVTADGSVRDLRAAAEVSIADLRGFGVELDRVSLKARADGEVGTVSAAVRNRGKRRAIVEVSTETKLNLQRPEAVVQAARGTRASWRLQDLGTEELPGGVTLPAGFSFSVSGEGEVSGDTLKALRGEGTLSSKGTHEWLGEWSQQLSFSLDAKRQQLSLEAELPGETVRAEVDGTVRLDTLLRTGELEIGPSRAEVAFNEGEGTLSLDYWHDGEARGTVNLDALDLSMVSPYVDVFVSGRMSGRAEIEWNKSAPRFSSTLSLDDIRLEEANLGSWRLEGGWSDGTAQLQGKVLQSGAEVMTLSARVPVAWNGEIFEATWLFAKKHELTFRLRGFDPTRIVAVPGIAASPISGWGHFTGDAGELLGEAELRLRPKHKRLGEVPVTLNWKGSKNGQKLSAVLSAGAFSADRAVLEMETQATPADLLKAEQSFRSLPFSVRFEAVRFNLDLLNAFDLSPIYDLGGILTCSVSHEGSLFKPKVSGSLTLEKGSASISDVMDPLTDIELSARFTTDRFQVDRLTFGSREGRAAISARGIFSPNGGLRVRAAAKARQLRIAAAGLPVFLLSSDIDAELRTDNDIVAADVRIGKTEIQHVSADTVDLKRVHINENTRVIEKKKRRRSSKRSRTPDREFRLNVKTVAPFSVRGAALDTAWKMDFSTRIRGDAASIDGSAVLTRGSFDLFANTFTVDDAAATFEPRTGLDPHIRLSASARLPDAKVYLGMEGTLSRPRLKLYSEPALPQDAIFALLISGSAEDNVSGSSVVANVLQMRYPVINKVLHDKLGFDRVAVGAGASGNGTVVKLGKRLNDKLFFYTSFNLHSEDDENDYAVHFEYNIVDRVTLDTMAGNETSSVEIGWQVPIDGKKKKERGRPPVDKSSGPPQKDAAIPADETGRKE